MMRDKAAVDNSTDLSPHMLKEMIDMLADGFAANPKLGTLTFDSA